MKKVLAFLAICFITAAVLSARAQQKNATQSTVKITPFNVKTGLWQSTTTLTITDGPAAGQPRTTTHKGCLTEQDLSRDPFADVAKGEGDMHCKHDITRSTATDAAVNVACSDSQGNTASSHLTFHAVDREHVTGGGGGTLSMYGQSMKSEWKFQSQWLQASCPANKE